MSRRLLVEVAAAAVIALLLILLAWWWNRPAPSSPQSSVECAAPVEVLPPSGPGILWCGEEDLSGLLGRVGLEACADLVRRRLAGEGPPLRLQLTSDCRVLDSHPALSGPVLRAMGEPVDLNLATADDLTVLPGIGPSLAATIVADRTANGPFCSPDDLRRVKGLGPKRVAQVRDEVKASCR